MTLECGGKHSATPLWIVVPSSAFRPRKLIPPKGETPNQSAAAAFATPLSKLLRCQQTRIPMTFVQTVLDVA
jgi:hypothetical protein